MIQIEDRYLLYYSVSSFGVNTSAIALVSTQSLNPEDDGYGWKDHGIVVSTTQDDNFNAIDPALLKTDTGQLWMSFGSFWSGLKLLQLEPSTGTRKHTDTSLHSLAWSPEIEAPISHSETAGTICSSIMENAVAVLRAPIPFGLGEAETLQGHTLIGKDGIC